MPERVGGTGSLRCEEEVLNMAGTWGGYNANPNHRCRYKAKYLYRRDRTELLVCGVHAAQHRRWDQRINYPSTIEELR